jgi:NitT/TauT family transport system substrate-binding protein
MKRAAFTILAAGAAATPRIASAQTLTPVRLGTFPVESYGLAYYAKEQGFFARNGLDVTVGAIPGASGGIAGALVGGALDVGCVSIGPLASAHLRGIPMRIIAPGGIVVSTQPTTAMVVASGSTIRSAKDLNGKTVGTAVLRDLMHVATLKWIDANGGDSKTVKIIEMPAPDAGIAIAAGRIDAYPIPEPLLTFAEGQNMRNIGGIFGSLNPRIMISMHVAMQDWLDKNAAAARRTVLALRQAAQWANANPAGVAAIIENIAKIPAATIAKMKHIVNGETLEVATIQPQIDALAEYGFIANKFSVNDLIWPPARSV